MTCAFTLSKQTHAPQVKTSRTFLRDCTVVSPLALLLFGGPLNIVHESAYIALDHFRVCPEP